MGDKKCYPSCDATLGLVLDKLNKTCVSKCKRNEFFSQGNIFDLTDDMCVPKCRKHDGMVLDKEKNECVYICQEADQFYDPDNDKCIKNAKLRRMFDEDQLSK